MDATSLLGRSRLVSYEVRSAGGSIDYPLGRDLQGYVIYTADGFMSATLTRPGRPLFSAPDILRGSTDEKVAAVEGYIAYCGRYDYAMTGWSITSSSACSRTGLARTRSGWSS